MFGASSELARSKPASVIEFGTNQLRTCSELASVMEFGFKHSLKDVYVS